MRPWDRPPIVVPKSCWCGTPLREKQRQRWWYRAIQARREKITIAPPACSQSCSTKRQHEVDPERFRDARRVAVAKRPDTLFKMQVIDTCPLPPGRERDLYIYRVAYKAGRVARTRETAQQEQVDDQG
jgi:hypothetical protein